jgi:tetratricopeptide (TPR) repeat protein
LAIREKTLGSEHPDTATSLNDLGRLLSDQGDFAGARPLLERALAIREKALGSEHLDTATSLNDLAFLLQAQGESSGARPLYERAPARCLRNSCTSKRKLVTSSLRGIVARSVSIGLPTRVTLHD